MRASVKYRIIFHCRHKYPISLMTSLFTVSRSGYYQFLRRKEKKSKDRFLVSMIRKQQKKCRWTYGYRRIWIWLKKEGVYRNPKTILRLMHQYGLLAKIRRRKQWQQLSQQQYKYKNLLNRQFQAGKPNEKWVTDISYIQTKHGTLFLCIIRDLYDKSIIAYRTGGSQTSHLVTDTVRDAVKKSKKRKGSPLYLHSDQGGPYTSEDYAKAVREYGIIPSMSRRGNCYDNAMAENFFSILKAECIYRHKPENLAEAREMIDRYIRFYNNERIQLKTGKTPREQRLSA